MEIKAIETQYKGYRFRSRLEARWAVFFDALGLEWEYEKEGFELKDGTRYLPDFWLPQVELWAEVKPFDFSDEEINKASQLVLGTHHSLLMLIGTPENKPYTGIEPTFHYPDDINEWTQVDPSIRIYDGVVVGACDYCLTMFHNYPIDEHRFYCNPGDYDPGGDAYFDDTELAARAARSARFEHGETPNTDIAYFDSHGKLHAPKKDYF